MRNFEVLAMMTVRLRRFRTLLFCLAIGFCSGVGCEGSVGPEDRSGADSSRGGAQAMPIETPVTDALNYEGGDATDWKIFEVSQSGPVTVDVFFDTDYVEGVITVHDQYGTELASRTRTPGQQQDQIVVNLPEASSYYVRIHLTAYYSTYSIVVTPGEGGSAGGTGGIARPVLDEPL